MAFKMQSTRFTSATAEVTQDIAITDFGTVDAVVFVFGGEEITADGVVAGAVLGMGFTDTAGDYAVSCSNEDGQGSSDSERNGSDTKCITIFDENGTLIAEADYTQLVTDGVRITWSTNNLGTGVLITAVFLGGTDAVLAGAVKATTKDAKVEVTTNFPTSFLILASSGQTNFPTTNNHAFISFGFAVNDGSDTQVGTSIADYDGAGTSVVNSKVMSNRVMQKLWNDTDYGSIEVDNFTATTFDIYARGVNLNEYICYLAVDLPEANIAKCGIMDTPTATGNDVQTGPDIQPEIVMLLLNMCRAADTRYDAADDVGSLGVSVFDSAGAEYCHAISWEDGEGTSDTESAHDDIAVFVNQDGGEEAFDATYVSMNADGWTLNFSVTDGTARKWPWLAIGAAGVEDYSLVAEAGSITLTGQVSSLLKDSKVSVGSGSIVLTGKDASLLVGYLISVAGGSIALTGQTADLLKGFKVSVESGSIILTGQDASLLVARSLSLNNGIYSVAGQNVELLKGYFLSSGSGAYTITGADVTLTYSTPALILDADVGTFTITGQAADLLYHRKIPIESGAITLTGQEAGLLYSRILSAENGTFTITGQDAEMLLGFLLSVSAGSIVLTGSDVTLTYTGVVTAGGLVVMTFTSKAPSSIFTSKAPSSIFTPKAPTMNFTN